MYGVLVKVSVWRLRRGVYSSVLVYVMFKKKRERESIGISVLKDFLLLIELK